LKHILYDIFTKMKKACMFSWYVFSRF